MSSLPSSLTRAATGIFGAGTSISTAFRPVGGFSAPYAGEGAIFQVLRDLYYGNDPWHLMANEAALASTGLGSGTIRGLRNPAMAVTEYYVSVICPGALPDALPLDVADGLNPELLQAAAEQLWTWSNWAAKKQTYVRTAAMLGECYLKVSTKPDGVFPPQRVYLEVIQPDYINCADSERDERGFVTRLRLDMPERAERYDGTSIAPIHWHTEVWDKDTQTARHWTKQSPTLGGIADLGTPDMVLTLAEQGMDFVPFVHVPMLDLGEDRGVSPVLLALEKIKELDQLATSLHQSLYRYNSPDKIIEGTARGSDGDVPAPPRLSQTETFQIAGVNVYSLPPGWTLHNDVAGVHYAEQLQAIEAHWNALRETSLPELYYWAMADTSAQESGRALQTRMKGAISRATEARGNLEVGLVRAMQMAFSIAKTHKLEPFTALGDYAKGEMDFAFRERDVLPQSEQDNLDLLAMRASTLKTFVDAGASIEGAAMLCGISAEDAALLAGADLSIVQP